MNNQEIVEDDQLYLSEGIQEHGFLLIINHDYSLVALSENCSDWLTNPVNHYIGSNIWELIANYFPNYHENLKKGIDEVFDDSDERVWMEVEVGSFGCYLNVYGTSKYIYLEFEKKAIDQNVFFPKIEVFNNLLVNNKDRIWEVTSAYISKISGFDRIRVFAYDKDNNGLIIAENIEHPDLEGILGCYYPYTDVFRLARNIHVVNYSRYTAQINGPTIKIISNGVDHPNLSQTGVRMVSPIHAAYMLKDGVNSNLSISIIVDGALWGYVFCQSKDAKKVNLLKREALVYFIQMAVNQYVENQELKDRKFYEEIRDFELLLKEKLLVQNDLYKVLNELGDRLCYFAKADAMAILSKDDLHTYNISIGKRKVDAIVDQIRKVTKESYFSDEEFVFKYGKKLGLEIERFAGISAICVDEKESLAFLFFRKEKIQKRKWVEKPEELIAEGKPNVQFVHEDHSYLDVWHQTTYHASEKWTEMEFFFFKRLREIVLVSFRMLAEEIHKLNLEVLNLNTALDNYANTVSHDLKNPLSAINLSVQMMMQKPDMSEELKMKMLKNTKEAVSIINEMLRSIHEFSKVKGYDYKMESVYTQDFIPQIVDFSKLRYAADHAVVEFGNLFPLHGEKTIIYQLFQNLIGNAVKYSAKSASPKIKIYSELENEFVRYHIIDNGIGMAKEELNNVFDSFKRLSNASEFEGTGLGLSIVKRIAERLHVKVQVESEIGLGTAIQLTFPNDN